MEVKSVIIGNLVLLATTYCDATGRSRSAVSKIIHGRGGQIDDLASGHRDLTTGVAEGALRWFSDNWPAGLEWPAGIDRPQPQPAATLDPNDADALDGVAAGSAPVSRAEPATGPPI